MLTSLCCGCFDFYPRSPCGERPFGKITSVSSGLNFYPRSPCGERRKKQERRRNNSDFYPRSPCGERLAGDPPPIRKNSISIHALLAESDANAAPTEWTAT